MVEVLATKKEGKPLLKRLAQKGRNGDDRVARLRPEQMALLRKLGGSGSVNPETGLPEYFLEGLNTAGSTGLGPDPLRLRGDSGGLGTGTLAGPLTPTTSGAATSPFSKAAQTQDSTLTSSEGMAVDTLGSQPGPPGVGPVGPTGVAMSPGIAGLTYGLATGQPMDPGFAIASMISPFTGPLGTIVGLIGNAVNAANAMGSTSGYDQATDPGLAAAQTIGDMVSGAGPGAGPAGQGSPGAADVGDAVSGAGPGAGPAGQGNADAAAAAMGAGANVGDAVGGAGPGAGSAGQGGSGQGGAGGSGASGGDVAGGVGGSETGSTGTLKDGGRVGKPLRSLLRRRMPRSGLITGSGAGRADDVPMKAPRGTYVIPADAVAAAGEGNSNAGAQKIGQKLGIPQGAAPAQSGGDKNVKVSGGEFMINDPNIIAQLGGGDLDRGYKMLDEFVKSQRARMIQTLQRAKAPRES